MNFATWFGDEDSCVDGNCRELSLIDISIDHDSSTNTELVGERVIH